MDATIVVELELFAGLGLIVTVGGAWTHLAILLDRIHRTLPGLRAELAVLQGKVEEIEKTVSRHLSGP